jgi:hypothetical protein
LPVIQLCRHCADLLHERQRVGNSPVLGDLAVLDTDNVDPAEFNISTRWRNSHEVALVGTRKYSVKGLQISVAQ